MKLKLSKEGLKLREVKDHVQDVYDAMEAAEEFVSGWSFEEFDAGRKIQFTGIRVLEIIGEATKNISSEVCDKYPFVPWKDLAGIGQIDPRLLLSEPESSLVIR